MRNYKLLFNVCIGIDIFMPVLLIKSLINLGRKMRQIQLPYPTLPYPTLPYSTLPYPIDHLKSVFR